jgi:hypothetical protein
MDLVTISELMYLTCEELCDLSMRIERNLNNLEAGTVARTHALTSLGNIRRVMILRGLHFKPARITHGFM